MNVFTEHCYDHPPDDARDLNGHHPDDEIKRQRLSSVPGGPGGGPGGPYANEIYANMWPPPPPPAPVSTQPSSSSSAAKWATNIKEEKLVLPELLNHSPIQDGGSGGGAGGESPSSFAYSGGGGFGSPGTAAGTAPSSSSDAAAAAAAAAAFTSAATASVASELLYDSINMSQNYSPSLSTSLGKNSSWKVRHASSLFHLCMTSV